MLMKHVKCVDGSMVRIRASQAWDPGSIPGRRRNKSFIFHHNNTIGRKTYFFDRIHFKKMAMSANDIRIMRNSWTFLSNRWTDEVFGHLRFCFLFITDSDKLCRFTKSSNTPSSRSLVTFNFRPTVMADLNHLLAKNELLVAGYVREVGRSSFSERDDVNTPLDIINMIIPHLSPRDRFGCCYGASESIYGRTKDAVKILSGDHGPNSIVKQCRDEISYRIANGPIYNSGYGLQSVPPAKWLLNGLCCVKLVRSLPISQMIVVCTLESVQWYPLLVAPQTDSMNVGTLKRTITTSTDTVSTRAVQETVLFTSIRPVDSGMEMLWRWYWTQPKAHWISRWITSVFRKSNHSVHPIIPLDSTLRKRDILRMENTVCLWPWPEAKCQWRLWISSQDTNDISGIRMWLKFHHNHYFVILYLFVIHWFWLSVHVFYHWTKSELCTCKQIYQILATSVATKYVQVEAWLHQRKCWTYWKQNHVDWIKPFNVSKPN